MLSKRLMIYQIDHGQITHFCKYCTSSFDHPYGHLVFPLYPPPSSVSDVCSSHGLFSQVRELAELARQQAGPCKAHILPTPAP